MGASKRRVLAILIAAVMVMTSAIGVFAADKSPDIGSLPTGKTTTSVSKGTISVEADGAVKYKVNGSKKSKTATDGIIKNLKKGDTVEITATVQGKKKTIRVWVQTTKVTKAKNKKVTWKKVKGASYYKVKIVSKSGKVSWKTVKKGTSVKVAKGSKVSVMPVKKVKGKVYKGVTSKSKTVK